MEAVMCVPSLGFARVVSASRNCRGGSFGTSRGNKSTVSRAVLEEFDGERFVRRFSKQAILL